MESSGVLISDAADYEYLRAALQRIDISVPGRTEGRTTKHVEILTICHLLSTLANDGRIVYPLSLHHEDKPDFLVHFGDAQIGVEITEAIPQNFAAYRATAASVDHAIIDPGLFRPGSPKKRTKEKMLELLSQDRLSSPPWVGDSMEREWADQMLSAVNKKLERLAKHEFRKFERNWLSVYDNLPQIGVRLEDAIGFLRPLLQDRWQCSPAFDTLFIEQGQVVIRITANDSEQLALNDLWRLPETSPNPSDGPSP